MLISIPHLQFLTGPPLTQAMQGSNALLNSPLYSSAPPLPQHPTFNSTHNGVQPSVKAICCNNGCSDDLIKQAEYVHSHTGVLAILLNYLVMVEILTQLGYQDSIMDIIVHSKRALQFDERRMMAMDLIAKFSWSEHSYHHKNQWYSWAKKAAWFKCWDPQIPTDCGVHFPLCLYDYRLIVNSQCTPTYITFGLAFSICGVQVGQWNRGNDLMIFPRNITNVILPRRPSVNRAIYLRISL